MMNSCQHLLQIPYFARLLFQYYEQNICRFIGAVICRLQ
jgi:hypothetical protein